jgi:hypothetical protein
MHNYLTAAAQKIHSSSDDSPTNVKNCGIAVAKVPVQIVAMLWLKKPVQIVAMPWLMFLHEYNGNIEKVNRSNCKQCITYFLSLTLTTLATLPIVGRLGLYSSSSSS